jgi:hypothetical protein
LYAALPGASIRPATSVSVTIFAHGMYKINPHSHITDFLHATKQLSTYILTITLYFNSSVDSIAKRWATKKTGGSTKNGRDSNPKYLGVKKYGGEVVKPGTWIIRQRGKKYPSCISPIPFSIIY